MITEIPLNVALLEYEIPKKLVYRTWGVADEPIGDPLARRAEELLRRDAPYPGDDLTNEETFSDERFLIYRISDTRHVIMDHASYLEDEVEIPSYLLRNPAFFVSDWYSNRLAAGYDIPKSLRRCMQRHRPMGDALADRVTKMLNRETRLPGEPRAAEDRFTCDRLIYDDGIVYEIVDHKLDYILKADDLFLCNERLNVAHWYAKHLLKGYKRLNTLMLSKELEWENHHFRSLDSGDLSPMECALEDVVHQLYAIPDMQFEGTAHRFQLIELNGQQVVPGRYPAIQRNSAIARDFKRLIPKPVVVVAHVNGCPVRALIDMGSLADFMSSTLADQLKVKQIPLEKPLTI
ncbi:uncharacterized protein F5147DRAFT_563758 [Suillus discolor]|uniref:Uncharacterized protein n=1 Tax=Suillus discolor TaxID=1912936 RepID=A0A9P7FJE7_9AGAM|nr:uncharacterized protein F5147DRAFT_563758 [Suillus discolor]KAG2119711.1 hypothetical protein F5147DRAFT_563758 [Suillus discolor]